MVIVFDLSGVFFNDGLTFAIKEIVEKFKLDPADIENVLSGDFAKEYRTGLIEVSDFWKKAQEYWKVDSVVIEKIREIFFNAYVPQQETIDFIKELKQNAFKVAFLSNNPKDRAEFLDNKYHFLELFDFGVFSYQVHAWKPEKDIYTKFMEKYNVSPQDIIYIEDRERHIQPAKELGWKTILFKDVKQAKSELSMLTNK